MADLNDLMKKSKADVARRKREEAKRKQNPISAAYGKIFGTSKKIDDAMEKTKKR